MATSIHEKTKQEWMKKLGNQLITVAVGAISALTVFYFQTKEEIKSIKVDLIEQKGNSNEFKQVHFEVIKLNAAFISYKENQERINKEEKESQKVLYDRQEKIYDILIEMNKNR